MLLRPNPLFLSPFVSQSLEEFKSVSHCLFLPHFTQSFSYLSSTDLGGIATREYSFRPRTGDELLVSNCWKFTDTRASDRRGSSLIIHHERQKRWNIQAIERGAKLRPACLHNMNEVGVGYYIYIYPPSEAGHFYITNNFNILFHTHKRNSYTFSRMT